MRPPRPALRTALALTAIVGVYVALYAPARHFDFVWIDGDALRDSAVFDLPLAQQLRTTEHARMNPTLMAVHGIELAHESYRPLLIWTHGLDIRWFGRVPGPMHVHSCILGGLGILAAFWLAARLLAATTSALVVTALFAWHPLHVEPICFLSARGDPLAGLLGLVAAALVVEAAPPGAIRPRSPAARAALAVGAGVALLLSLFAKEATLLVPLAMAGFALATGRLRAWRDGLVALALAVAAYAGLRAILVAGAPAATHGAQIAQAITALPAIWTEYTRSFLLPFDISIARPLALPVTVGVAFVVVVGALVLAGLVRAPADWRSSVGLAAGGLVWAALLITPAAVAVLSEGALADRYAYLPIFGFALALVALGRRAAAGSGGARAIAGGAAALFAAMCVFVTAREVPAWAANGTLYAHAVDVELDSASAHGRLGRWLCERGAWSQAVPELETAVKLPGADVRMLDNLGVAYMNVGRPADAVATLRAALARSHESSFNTWYNLGTAQRLMGDGAAACASYRRAIAISPEYGRAQADLARYCR